MITIMAILIKIKDLVVKYWKQLLLVGLGAFLMLKMQSCVHKVFPPKNPISGPSGAVVAPVLPKKDAEQIVVKNNEVQVITPKGTTVTNGSRGVTIDIQKDGTIKVTPKIHGFVLNPMLGLGVNNTGVKGIVGAELYFYKKLDLVGGIGADKYISHAALFAALGYTPENHIFHNTSFWIGPSIDTTGIKSVMVGVSVRI